MLMWWPNIDKDIENNLKPCSVCQASRPLPPFSYRHDSLRLTFYLFKLSITYCFHAATQNVNALGECLNLPHTWFLEAVIVWCVCQAWGKYLGQMLEVLLQVLGKVLKHKHKCFNKANASSTK